MFRYLYSWATRNHYLFNIAFAFILVFTLWSLVNEKNKVQFLHWLKSHFSFVLEKIVNWLSKQFSGQENKLSQWLKKYKLSQTVRSNCDRKYGNILKRQCQMLICITIVNIFSFVVYDDYYMSTQYLSITVSIVQVIALVRVFILKCPKEINRNLKLSFVIGMLSIVLAFTHIYFYLFLYNRDSFANFYYVGMNGGGIDDWLNCLFYAISLIIPYSLTELIPNTYWMKTISLFQVTLFYVFVFEKLSNVFSHRGNTD